MKIQTYMPSCLQYLRIISLLLITYACAEVEAPVIETGGLEKIAFRVLPFDGSQIQLLDGPFQHATELNRRSLLRYEPDRFLAKFRQSANLEPKAEHYHGWEDATIAGHSLGHHLSACALMYESSRDSQFLERVNYIVDELALCQQAGGDGYVGAIPDARRIFMEEIAQGDIQPQPFFINGLWAPFYNLHKTLAGLRDAHRLTNNNKALDISKGLADWIALIFKELNEEQIQQVLSCEHGGINEVLADLYADTGEERFLELSLLFHHHEVLHPLSEGKDILPNIHANTQIPKLIGLARRYELTAKKEDGQTAAFFWERVTNHHSYVTGGHGNHEYFGQPDQLRNRLSDETTETCNVYNMLKLTRHLFQWDASPATADFYERALFNHILSSQHPKNGKVIYNLSLEMGGKKTYQDPYWFTCCVGSGMETHSKYGRNIFFHNEEELFVSQFIAAELNWPEKGMQIRQETSYPDEQGTRLLFNCEKPEKLTVHIRYPSWLAAGDMEIKLNGKPVSIQQNPGSFVPIKKKWRTGDRLEVSMPFSLRLEAMPDDPDRIAICYGPLVLAGDLGPEDDPAAHTPGFVPVLMTDERNPDKWLEPIPNEVNVFRTKGIGNPRDIVLKPFYLIHERRYSVYWDLMNEDKLAEQAKKAQLLEVQEQKLKTLAVDYIDFGDVDLEKAHKFSGDLTNIGEHQGKKFRSAERGGYFELQLKVPSSAATVLVADYWGGFTGSKTYDIVVDGQTIATENVSGKADGQFIKVPYSLPEQITKDKENVKVQFLPHEGHRAGPIFRIWALKEQDAAHLFPDG